MKKKNKPIKIIIIVIVALLVLCTSTYFYLMKGHWEEVVYERGSYTEKNNPTSSAIGFFHVRSKLETKLIFSLDILEGEYGIRIYKVPEYDDVYKMVEAPSEETWALYESGIRIRITENMEKVYECNYGTTGIYEFDTKNLEPGLYAIETFGSEDVDVQFVISFRFMQYNWMKAEERIKSLYSDEFNNSAHKYMPY